MSRRRPRSPPPVPVPVPPMEDDNLLSEILLRLSPDPSSLPRASLVSKRWLGLISDPAFSRRFRLHHRRNPPLVGFFYSLGFMPTMDPPNRVLNGRFSLCQEGEDWGGIFMPLGSRHGLLLIFNLSRNQILVRDPFNVDQHCLAVPPEFHRLKAPFSGAVFRAAGDIQHFRVVLVSTETGEQQHTTFIARVYSSETGGWGDRISTPHPSKLPTKSSVDFTIGVLVGRCLYWLFNDRSPTSDILDGILEFDLERQILAVEPVPVGIPKKNMCQFQVMRAEGGGLGILFLSNFSAQLWKMETDSDGVASWVLGRTVELDKLFSLNTEEGESLVIQGFAEYNNMVFLRTRTNLFTIQLESLQFKKVFNPNIHPNIHLKIHPFESVYAAGTGIGGGHDGPELLRNT